MGVGVPRHAPAPLPPERRPGTFCVGGWLGPGTGLDWCEKSRPNWDTIPGPSSLQRVAIPITVSREQVMAWRTCKNLGRQRHYGL